MHHQFIYVSRRGDNKNHSKVTQVKPTNTDVYKDARHMLALRKEREFKIKSLITLLKVKVGTKQFAFIFYKKLMGMTLIIWLESLLKN